MNRFLGKKPPKIDPRTLKLAKYLAPSVIPPAEVSWIMKVAGWPMLLNDSLGDCVPAAGWHSVEQWSHYANPPGYVPTDADALKTYEVVGGYVPGNPATDNGCVILDMLNYWRQTGIGSHKISGYVSVDLKNQDEIKAAIWLFGNLFLGIQLPVTAQSQQDAWTVADGGVYTDAGAPGSWGGHCVPVMAASPMSLTCITWGQRMKMSWNFLSDYADEAYAILSPDWIGKGNVSPGNVDLETLQADLAAL